MSQELVGTVVSDEKTPSYSTVLVNLSAGKTTRPGELLMAEIESGVHYSMGRVTEGKEVNPYETSDLSHMRTLLGLESPSRREDLPRKFRVVFLDLLEEMKQEGKKWVLREPQTLIPAGSNVYRVTEEVAMKTVGLDTGDEKGIEIGTVVGSENLKVVLDPNKVLPRQTLIVGTTGTGKSWLRGVIAEELHRIGIPQVNIDLHGESITAAGELGGENLVPGRSLTVKLSSLTEPEVIGLVGYLHELHEQIISRAFIELKRKSGLEGFTTSDLIQEAEKFGPILGAQPKTMNIVRARLEGLRFQRIIGKGIPWTELLKPGAFINIDARGMSHNELQAIAGAVGRELLALRMHGMIPPLVLSIDEAHMFIPQGEESPSSQVLREVIRWGRHYGVCLILLTPSPTDIDRKTIRITNTRFIFAIEPDQLEALRGVFADAPEEIIRRLPKLEQGTCLLTGSRETIRHAILVKVKGRKTTHGGATPDIVEEANNFKPKTVTVVKTVMKSEPVVGEKKTELEKWFG
jgi:DNA helicase HerA-like ATPase